MIFIDKIKQFLSQPFLIWEYTTIRKIIVILSFQVFSISFIYFYTPFDFNNVPKIDRFLLVLAQSLWSTFILSIFYFVVPLSFRGYFKDSNRTIFRESVWVVSLVVCAALGHRSITLLFGDIPFRTIFGAIGLVVSISIFPFFILLLLAINRMTKIGHENFSDENRLIEISSNVGNEKIKLFLRDILYIKSLDNYSEVYFINGMKIQKKILRIPLSTLNTQLNSEYFVRSHRSYIVNLFNIEKIKGNANASKIYQKGNNISIPVSKSRRDEVFSKLNKLPISYST